MVDIKGKYLIITNISSSYDNFLTVMYANDVEIAPMKEINILIFLRLISSEDNL